MSKGDNLGTRMKSYYENISRQSLYRKIPVILRLDGKAFHTFTKGSNKPFDDKIIKAMQLTTKALMHNIQGAKAAYVQSDEISILLTDYDSIETCAWYDYNIQKMCSVAASMAGVFFTLHYHDTVHDGLNVDNKYPPVKMAFFDCRAFNIPKEEVVNCFRWRYQDWLRNSIQMLAQSMYSQKELNGVSCKQLITKMETEKNVRWDELGDVYKNGTMFYWVEEGDRRALFQDSGVNLNSNQECEYIFEDYV